MATLLTLLEGGDLRSIGRANEVAQKVFAKPKLVSELIEGLDSEDPRVRMRAADALEKVCDKNPEMIQPAKRFLLKQAGLTEQQEVRWHLAQIFASLELTPEERKKVATIPFKWLKGDKSKIVQAFCLQTLAELAVESSSLRTKVKKEIGALLKTGSPAVKARCRKLIKVL